MIVIESLIELISRKDKFEFSQPKEKGNGGEDEEGQVEYSNDNGGNGKPNNSNEKKSGIQCFLCGGSHMVMDYLK